MARATFHNHSAGAEMASSNGFSQCAKLPNGVVVLSGMVGVDSNVVAMHTLEEQISMILLHIKAALAVCGARPIDVYKIVSYHLDLAASTSEFITKWAKEFGTKPTWTAVGVKSLGVEGAFLEVQVEAWPSSD